MEEWRDVAGYEGLYQVSSLGRVRGKHRVISGSKNSKGYLCFWLYRDGKRSKKRAHRLVAEAFIPNPDGKPQINHKNGVKTDNRVDNLEWCSNSENITHAYKMGLNQGAKKPVIMDGKIVYESEKAAAESIGVSHQYVSMAAHGIRKTALGHTFRFLS